MTDRTCTIADCEREQRARGMCTLHYQRWAGGRDLNAPTRKYLGRAPVEERFWSKVDKRGPDECWPWAAYVMSNGYAQFYFNGHMRLAHRVAYELFIGPIPDGLEIDHVWARGCTRRDCVNPAHLEAVTGEVNNLRGNSRSARQARQTHCKRGHELAGKNLSVQSDGSRVCLACRRLLRRLNKSKTK